MLVVIQTILILVIVYQVMKILLKLLAPRLLRYFVRKAEERFAQGPVRQHSTETKPDGDVTILKKSRRKSSSSKKVGEYIDFEEIK
ncbi:MAG: DUF4834 domain-containing protein [Bacteroidota bacterium]